MRRDEAEAAAREAAQEQRMQELDAARRIAILRGLPPPPSPPPIESQPEPRHAGPRHERDSAGGRDRKRRRLAGEDDTDRDIRLARTQAAMRAEDDEDARPAKRKPTSDAPLMDHAGHIDLFPIDPKISARNEKNAEAEADAAKKKREFEDQYTMRFSNAAGKQGLEKKPWYASTAHTSKTALASGSDKAPSLDLAEAPGKDAWGNEDPMRKERDRMRVSANDPLAFMHRAQTQLKDAERDRRKWVEERQREMKTLSERESRKERRKKNRPDHSEDDLEGFTLDATPKEQKEKRSGRREHESSRHRHHRSPSRSRERCNDDRGGISAKRRSDSRSKERHKDGENSRSHWESHQSTRRRNLSLERPSHRSDSHRRRSSHHKR